jgi:hypothetical protein
LFFIKETKGVEEKHWVRKIDWDAHSGGSWEFQLDKWKWTLFRRERSLLPEPDSVKQNNPLRNAIGYPMWEQRRLSESEQQLLWIPVV